MLQGISRLPRLPLAAFRRRALLRAVFLLLLIGSAALALQLLTEEKQRQQAVYEAGFRGQLDVLAERLRHPSGQLALLNAERPEDDAEQGQVPLRLPVGAIDFDDPQRAERVVELSGCASRWSDGDELCIGVGQRASAGAFVYAVGRLALPDALQGRARGQTELSAVHRVRIELQHPAGSQTWTAPLELLSERRGQLSGFADLPSSDELPAQARPDRDFRAWLWQDATTACADCPRRALLSLRIPVALPEWRDAARQGSATWPPPDLSLLRVRLRLLGPDGVVLLNSQRPGASAPASLRELRAQLRPGERLSVWKGERLLARVQAEPEGDPAYPWLTRLIRRLPAARLEGPLSTSAELAPSAGGAPYRVQLEGDLRAIARALSATATRYTLYFALLAGAIALAWLIVEIGLLRRMALLTRRANALTRSLQERPDELPPLDVADLKGRDELGILAGSLAELLARSREHLRHEQIRAVQEREQWHAVGHEIMSPLQALLALHGGEHDPSRRYLQRMQAALQLLYGQASVGEAMHAATAQRERLDLAAFLREVAVNAPYAGIEEVRALDCESACEVFADPLKLEDALTHLLNNAARHRVAGTPISLRLSVQGEQAQVEVHNQGPRIAEERLASLFELGASDAEGPAHRGQGLFVARTYLAKMGGAIAVRNVEDGVSFELTLQRA